MRGFKLVKVLKRKSTRNVACAALCATAMLCGYAQVKKARHVQALHLDRAYFAGELVKFESVPVSGTRSLIVGPWNLGPKTSPGPSDKRPNLYFVSPGRQHLDSHEEFDHNEVISAVPKDGSDFDVWWVVVLDPSAKQDFTSEQQIILATQQTFQPGPDFKFEDIPAAGFLRTFMKVTDLHELEKYRRPDGELPRVAIVRAGFTVRARAEEIKDEPAVSAESGEKK